ncbi:orotate phosphoribosyltransferase [Salinicoccus albus]|uniref:orotate phosphoribosyltransferase n=1 Tax=Salinicoccus albus TaxID=418756 RepID=UPI00037B8F19|nr:orotate phosphoribosyltransferase [Salinicoccus albus]
MKQRTAEILLDINAVELRPDDPFTWSSGIISPIYCDNRKMLGDISAREEIAEQFVELIETHAPGAQVIAGTSTAGIPHAAFVSERLGLPMCYVRGGRKNHGKGNQIEGAEVRGKKVAVIEDLISTGASSLDTAQALKEKGGKVLGIFAIFTYGLGKSIDAFEEAGIDWHTLSDLDTLIDVSMGQGSITEEQKQVVLDFRERL